MIVPIALLAAQLNGPSETRRLFAAGEKDVVMMLPQETVCGSEVHQMAWNAEGTHLIAVRGVVDLSAADVVLMTGAARPTPEAMQRLRPRTELITWSLKTRKTQTVLVSDATRLSLEEILPIPSSDRVILRMTAFTPSPTMDGAPVPMQGVSILSPALGKVSDVLTSAVEQGPVLYVSDTRPLAALVKIDAVTQVSTARLFGPAGVLGQSFTFPKGRHFMFDGEGRPSFVSVERKPDGKRQVLIHQIDPNTGRQISVAPFDPALEPKAKIRALTLADVAGRVEQAKAPSIFLKVAGGKKGEEGVVTTDGTKGLLSPKEDAVAYLSQGSMMVRRFAHVDRKVYEGAIAAAQKTIAMSNAKQAALALLMYAADMDDVLPGNGDYNKIEPYLKNDSIMNAFTYTYGGGKATDIDNPAETQIGYVSGPGGRAVAYADGHVRWIPDAP